MDRAWILASYKLAALIFTCIYYMEESVLLGTKPLVDSIRHFMRDPSGVFSVCHLCECRIVQWRLAFPPFAFFEMVSPYNKKNITRWREDMNFMFEWQKQYLIRSLRSLVRYCSCHSNIKFISSRHRVISSIYPMVSAMTSYSSLTSRRIFCF